MNVRLVTVPSSPQTLDIPLDALPAVIGRGADATVRISDPWVSRNQCRIDAANGKLMVRDLGSKHGTFVNGGAARESVLMPQDELCVGLTKFRVHYNPAASESGSDLACEAVA